MANAKWDVIAMTYRVRLRTGHDLSYSILELAA